MDHGHNSTGNAKGSDRDILILTGKFPGQLENLRKHVAVDLSRPVHLHAIPAQRGGAAVLVEDTATGSVCLR
jgi:hypothetical protein